MKRLLTKTALLITLPVITAGAAVSYYVYSENKEPAFGLDCHHFSNGVMVGAPPEYRRHPSIKDGLNVVDAKRFSVEYPSFDPKNHPTKEEREANPSVPRLELLLFSVRKTIPGFMEKYLGPNPKGNLPGFNVPDGEIYGLERWQLPASNDFRNRELYKYVSGSGYVDSVMIQCDVRPINVEGASATCQMMTEYEGGIRIQSNFLKSWLPNWKAISEGLNKFLNEKLINEWGQQCHTLIQKNKLLS